MPIAPLQLRLFGACELQVTATMVRLVPAGKAQALLAYLALSTGQVHPRDKLAALLWPDMAPGAARKQLRQTLFVLQKVLSGVEPPVLTTTGNTIALRVDALDLDVTRFESAIAKGTADSLQDAADLYRGDLLAESRAGAPQFDDWLAGERKRLRELVLHGLERLLARHRATGASGAALAVAARLLALDPLEERTHRALMRIHLDLGSRDAALRQYQECVGILRRELNLQPEAETRRLYEEIVRTPEPLATAVTPGSLLVGREAEVARLQHALTHAWRGPSGHVIAVIGEAGVGKTRLLTVLAEEAERRGGAVLIGRSYESEQVLPLGPWVSAVREAAALPYRRVLDATDVAKRAQLARLFPELLAAGSGPNAGDSGDAERLLDAFAELLCRLAELQPLVIVLEDIHWADVMTLRLLALVGRRCHTTPMLVAVSVREEEPGHPAVRSTLDTLEAEQRLVRLAVAPLGHDDTIALIQRLAHADLPVSVSPQRAEAIWKDSAGNPFIVVETLRATADGVDLESGGPLSLPSRVRETTRRRLARLDDDARQLVRVAAVIGREFDRELLRGGAAVDAPTAGKALEELVRRRVVHALGTGFDFVHERIREVAYEAMLPVQRKLLHRQVAETLEATGVERRDANALAVARHYRDAGVSDRAVIAFRRAAAYALSRAGYAEAVASLEQALAMLGNVPDGRDALEHAVDIRLELRTALYPLGEIDRAFAYLREAQPLAERLGDERRLGRVLAFLCVEFRRLGEFERAIEAGERALSIATAITDRSLQITTRTYLAYALWFSGAGRRAVEVFDGNVTSLTYDDVRGVGPSGSPAVLSMSYMATVLAELGDFAEANRVGARGRALAEELADPFTAIAARTALATVSMLAGEFADAVAGFEIARSECERGDFPAQRLSILGRLGYAYVLSGRLADGLALLEEAAVHVDRVDTFWRPRLLGSLAEGYLLAGRVEDAARVAERTQAITPENVPAVRAWTSRLAGEVAARRDPVDVDRAAGHYREAAIAAERLGLRLLRAHCHLGLGRLYRLAGDSRAAAELSAALAAFEAMALGHWVSVAESEVCALSR